MDICGTPGMRCSTWFENPWVKIPAQSWKVVQGSWTKEALLFPVTSDQCFNVQNTFVVLKCEGDKKKNSMLSIKNICYDKKHNSMLTPSQEGPHFPNLKWIYLLNLHDLFDQVKSLGLFLDPELLLEKQGRDVAGKRLSSLHDGSGLLC